MDQASTFKTFSLRERSRKRFLSLISEACLTDAWAVRPIALTPTAVQIIADVDFEGYDIL